MPLFNWITSKKATFKQTLLKSVPDVCQRFRLCDLTKNWCDNVWSELDMVLQVRRDCCTDEPADTIDTDAPTGSEVQVWVGRVQF